MTSDTEPPDSPRTRRFAGYDLVARVSLLRGIATYRAIQMALGRTVLVSVLPPAAGRIAAQREHFHRQQQMASRLSHVNVISTIDAGTYKGCRYFVTEHAGARTLRDEMREAAQFPVLRAVSVARDVARALSYLDAEGLVHRNVAPASIHLDETGVVKLAGFALAKDRRCGGSETWLEHDVEATYYLAPEILHGERGVDIRADVYSLGSVLYHMLTGHAPFQAASAAVVLESHATRTPTDAREFRDDLPPPLVEVLDRCLRKRREHRYARADDLARDLDAIRTGQPVSKMTSHGALWLAPSGPSLIPRIRRRRR